ncbi:hypothetical protein KC340_g13008 [Hortaea werneckii]|nr:hypothetical protein KC342_g13300 [Hortaea werneckii]KAI7093985.1 hypothetical protein KC339_g11862 [Hortaea werneckii]KAI7233400.1 hypothetical protein KC365_g6390 [Hortaea werneckii]KAI7301614.1 hypothetical protein KC340_g13008 [Hortaea werneckii]KAI7389747.1 hypothetical protein KC328_g8285 [Hortaea werneckii]
MPPTGSNHHCPVCGKAGFCKKHQVECKDPCHEENPFVHLKTEECLRCEQVKEVKEREQKKAEEAARKAEEKKKKKKKKNESKE